MWQFSKNVYHFFIAFLAALWFGFPSRKLTVIGITGTDGKTTTTHMVYEILKAAGKKVSMISTIQAIVGGKTYDTGFHVTTPDPIALERFLKQAVDHGDKYFVLEVSSHGLDQNRVAFVNFDIGILTTLTHEHLDYHKTFTNYAKAKFKLLRVANTVVIPYGDIPKEVLPFADFDMTAKQVITFGLINGNETQKEWKLKLLIPGDFNVLNALAAALAGTFLGLSKTVVRRTLEKFSGIPGRFEEISARGKFRVIIDFAHKPNALEQVLKTAKKELRKNGRIIVMYGCASQRDILKRPMMGEISGRFADISVLTDEDPRWEDSLKIIDEIAKGCIKAGAVEQKIEDGRKNFTKHVFFKIPNRALAIKFIIRTLAKKGDIILLCGKGHEAAMNYRGVEEPWSEHEAVRKALAKVKG